jgi:hypothetical protein
MTQVNKVLTSRILLLALTILFVAAMMFTAIKVTVVSSSVNAVKDLGTQTECAREVASDYDEYRDRIFAALTDRAEVIAAVEAFRKFKVGPNGKPESRAKRTDRLCPEI